MAGTSKAKSTDSTPPAPPPRKTKSKAARAHGPATGLPKTGSCKVSPAAVQFIIDMTVSGYSNGEILKALRSEMDLTITETTLIYHRNKNADKLKQSYDQEVEIARARTNFMFLSRRIALADELIQKELRKKKPSLYGVAAILSAADTAIHRAESRRMKQEELARKYREGNDGQKDELLAALERRTALIRQLEENEKEMLAIVDADFVVEPPRKLESLRQDVKVKALPEPLPAGGPEEGDDDDDGLDEDALLA